MTTLRLTGSLLAVAVLISGCATTTQDGANYTPPVTGGTSNVTVSGGTSAVSVARQLTSLGLSVTRQSNSVVEARGDGARSNLVDCGTIVQRAFGNSSVIEGNAARAAIYTSLEPPKLMVRETRIASTVRVTLGNGQARVQENHVVSIAWTSGGGRRIGEERETLSLGSSSEFRDGTVCATTGLVSQSLR